MNQLTPMVRRVSRQLPILLLLGVMALGTYARLKHAGDVPLCLDESWRISCLLDADNLVNQLFVGMNRTDPLFFNLLIFILGKLYNVEFVLRLSAIIPGLLTIPLAYLVGRHLFSSRWIAVLAGFLTAFSNEIMVYSKELKPYSLCVFVHLLVLYGYLKFRGNISRRTTILFTAMLAISIPVSLHSPFAFPGIYLALLAGTLLAGNPKQRNLVLASGLSLLIIAALCFFLLIGNVEDETQLNFMKSFWGNNFCPTESFSGMAAWLWPRYLEHFSDIAFANRLAPPLIRDNLPLIYLSLTLLGFIALLLRSRRRFFEAVCLFVLPLVVMALFSMFHLWPFGQLRMNIFVFVYLLFPPLFFLDELGTLPVKMSRNSRWSRLASSVRALPALTTCALMVIQFPVDFEAFSCHRATGCGQESAQALEHILDTYTDGPKIPLVCNHLGQSQFSYYSKYHRHISARYKEQAHLFDPRGMLTRSSSFYLRGTMLRVCQESRQAAIYLTHYLDPESMICSNEFCSEHDWLYGDSSYSCLITSDIYEAARGKKNIFSRNRYSGKSREWEEVYRSPLLDLEDAGPGALVVFNFDLDFHADFQPEGRRIRLAFRDQDESSVSFEKPAIDYDRPIRSDHLESAVAVALKAPVRQVRLVISVKGPYDFTMSNLAYFASPGHTWEPPDEPIRFVEDACEQIKLLRTIKDVENFWPNHVEGFGWTKRNSMIELSGLEIDPEERALMLETYGWMTSEIRELIMDSSMRVYLNRTHRAPLIKIEGEKAVKCYFQIPAGVRTIHSITITSRTFVPRDHGINNDGSALGIDLKSIGFPWIMRGEAAPPASGTP